MSTKYPINCVEAKKRLAELGFDERNRPVVWLWCKEHRTEHMCSLATMLQSWRDMIKGNTSLSSSYLTILKKAVGDIEADLEDDDIVEQKEEVM